MAHGMVTATNQKILHAHEILHRVQGAFAGHTYPRQCSSAVRNERPRGCLTRVKLKVVRCERLRGHLARVGEGSEVESVDSPPSRL